MVLKRHLKITTIEEKSKGLKDLENGLSNKDVSEKCGVPCFYVAKKIYIYILSDLEKSGKNPKRKCVLIVGRYEEVGKAIFQWFHAKNSQNVLINGVLLRQKALDFAKQQDQLDFKALD